MNDLVNLLKVQICHTLLKNKVKIFCLVNGLKQITGCAKKFFVQLIAQKTFGLNGELFGFSGKNIDKIL